jgi:hypothetical protein
MCVACTSLLPSASPGKMYRLLLLRVVVVVIQVAVIEARVEVAGCQHVLSVFACLQALVQALIGLNKIDY